MPQQDESGHGPVVEQPMSPNPVAALAQRAEHVAPCGDGYVADCPVHHDMTGHALSIQPDGLGGVTLRCAKGCDPASIRTFLVSRTALDFDQSPSGGLPDTGDAAPAPARPAPPTAPNGPPTEVAQPEASLATIAVVSSEPSDPN